MKTDAKTKRRGPGRPPKVEVPARSRRELRLVFLERGARAGDGVREVDRDVAVRLYNRMFWGAEKIRGLSPLRGKESREDLDAAERLLLTMADAVGSAEDRVQYRVLAKDGVAMLAWADRSRGGKWVAYRAGGPPHPELLEDEREVRGWAKAIAAPAGGRATYLTAAQLEAESAPRQMALPFDGPRPPAP